MVVLSWAAPYRAGGAADSLPHPPLTSTPRTPHSAGTCKRRPVLSVTEAFGVADAIAPRCRLLVLLAAFTTLRFGELAALRRKDIDLAGRLVVVRRAQAEFQDGQLFDKAPKSAAGVQAYS